MKKKFFTTLSAALILSAGMTSYAMDSSSEIRNSNAVLIHEDVSHMEALHDSSYDTTQRNNGILLLASDEVYWDTWGSFENKVVDGVQGAIPLGYSAHKRANTVLDTYHYTRTYLGAILKKGDSGRQWGSGTVKAEGKFCDDDVWWSNTHYVKYGTENN